MEGKVSKSGFCRSRIVLTFVLIDLIAKIFIALKPLKYIDGLLIPDDAYLSLTISKNISKGLGPLYGSEFTNGFQPLYVFLISPFYLLFPDDLYTPIHIALVILAIFNALTLYYLFKLIRLFTDDIMPVLFVGFSWLLTTNILKNGMNGLETAISFFLIVLTIYYFSKYKIEKTENKWTSFRLGILCGLAMFARIDNVFLLISISIIILISHKTFSIKNTVFVVYGAVAAITPWLLYLFFYKMSIVPVSGKAVRFMSLAQVNHEPTWENWYSKSLESACSVIYANNAVQTIVLVILILAIIIFHKSHKVKAAEQGLVEPGPANPLFPLILMSVFMFAAYTMYIFAFWFYGRYFYPLTLLFLAANMMLIIKLSQSRINKKVYNLIMIVILTGVLTGNIYKDNVINIYLAHNDKNWAYANVGLWCSENFASGTIIGCSQTGAIGYFAGNLKVINLDGVVNEPCFESLVRKTNIDYIKKQKIQFVMGWPENIRFIKIQSANFNETDLELIGMLPKLGENDYPWHIYKVNY